MSMFVKPFKRMDTSGIVTQAKAGDLRYASNVINNREKFIMCPYTEYIPLLYLQANTQNNFFERWLGLGYYGNDCDLELLGARENISYQEFNIAWVGKMVTAWQTGYLNANKSDMVTGMIEGLNRWLEFDSRMVPREMFNQTGECCGTEDIVKSFKEGKSRNYHQRSFQGYVSSYSLYLMDTAEYKPHILAVVLPENYMYQKYHMFVHGTYDLNKVIILIDRELDSNTFPNKPFRSLYKAVIGSIKESSCDVWKVPQDFILENCFYKEKMYSPKSMEERKSMVNKTIDDFYEYMSGKYRREENVSVQEQVIPTPIAIYTGEGIGAQVMEIGRLHQQMGDIIGEGESRHTSGIAPIRDIRYSIGADPYRASGSDFDYNVARAREMYPTREGMSPVEMLFPEYGNNTILMIDDTNQVSSVPAPIVRPDDNIPF